VQIGPTYCYRYPQAIVEFKVTEDEIEDKLYNEFVLERFNLDVSKFSYLFALLHEVGHHKTLPFVWGEWDNLNLTYDFCQREKERIETEMVDATEDEIKDLEWQYFNLPDEIMATMWAVNFVKKHPKRAKKMMKEINKNYQDFYRKNNVKI
jgi:hypothetical protein